ncbi:polysaccharide biosynthesis protein [Candidatus Pseudothioglobus sp. Uisw_050_01]|uniref:polysaccharide biosynthesis protein n=1 Tax=Candidatus Pseudothioglobus sp. Uisw_050_01 TaxID=3230997 RepID=UPI003A8A6BF4
MLNKFKTLSRLSKQLIMCLVDSLVIILVLLASFSVRLGYWYFPNNDLIWLIFGSPIIAIPIFIYFGLYTAVIRYIGFDALWRVAKAASLYALIWGVIGLMSGAYDLPRSVILINWVQAIFVIGALRIIARWVLYGSKLKIENSHGINVLIYGAGDAGLQLVSALMRSSQYNPVGFIDDSKELQNNQVSGLNIFSVELIGSLINKLKVDEILIAMPSVSRAKKRSILNKLEQYSVVVRILPSMSELAQGKVSIGDLRKVSIKDLLGRDVIEPNKKLLGANISKKIVMVTGAGGSIGSELSRQIIFLKPEAIILYEINELALYTIENELATLNFSDVKIYPILGSINNQSRFTNVLNHYGVNTIYHTAAYKHVPMVEFNITEGIYNNVFGTLKCAIAAIDAKVETFVLISTDKAVRPTNTMGASKRCAELIIQALSSEQDNTLLSMVRFGNVLGSSGSVIPLFENQIKQGGPVTVTDINIVRYFMTIPEAVELVIQAGAMAEGGDVFVLDMGKPVKIYDLAKEMIKLSGLQVLDEENPEGDIEIKFTGLRPGEKLYEELLVGKNTSKTDNELIMRAQEDMISWETLSSLLDGLKDSLIASEYEKTQALLINIVPEFSPQSKIVDLLYKKIR